MNKNTVLIRCDASARVGYGHLVRCLALAEAMRDSGRWEVIFAITEDQGGVEVARSRGFVVEHLRANMGQEVDSTSEGRWLSLLTERHSASLVVLDIRTGLSPKALLTLQLRGIKVALIDDGSERRLRADIAFYPPVPQIAQLDWSMFEGQMHVGWNWIVMQPAFAAERTRRPLRRSSIHTPKVLITMGGSDPAGVTLSVLRVIDSLTHTFEATIVLGKAFMHQPALDDLLAAARRQYRVLRDPASMAEVMAESDLAIASFGVTAYELAVMGVPAIHLCLTDDHAQSASAMADAGASVNLGVYTNVAPARLRAALSEWLENSSARIQAGRAAQTLIDGVGTGRVLRALDNLFEETHAHSA